ncbi:hypothetical protein PLESTM_000786600 [Pleodorina starrii]|nr:hypothetical protein PLESTM_000786600 [Pleodorina starrii]
MAGSAPYSVRLDPDVAQQLADQGGALLVIGMPEGSYFGIDHMAFRCGPRFRGIKMLPPGPHFVCYSIPGSERHGGGMGPVTGFFFHIAAASGNPDGGESGASTANVIVRRYDAAEELLVELPDEEAQRYALGVRRYEFDWGLAPYNLHAWQQWRELTSCLAPRVIDALQPVGGNICTAAEAALDEQQGGEAERPATEAEARLRKQLQEGRAARNAAAAVATAAPAATAAASSTGGEGPRAMEVETTGSGAGGAEGGGGGGGAGQTTGAAGQAGGGGGSGGGAFGRQPEGGRAGAGAGGGAASSGRCFYSPLPRLVKEAGLTPAQLTSLNMDRTAQLEALAAERWGGDTAAVVGEMQFAFIAFVFGQSLQGFRQWRALLTLLLNCEAGPLGALAPTFAAFTAALRAQLSLALSDAAASAGLVPPPAVGGAGVDVAAALGLATHGSSSLVEEVLLAGGGRDCFLRHHLGTFFEVLREGGPQRLDTRLQQEAAQLRAVLSRVVGWQFDGLEVLGEDDDDEYGPVVVELTPEQLGDLGEQQLGELGSLSGGAGEGGEGARPEPMAA